MRTRLAISAAAAAAVTFGTLMSIQAAAAADQKYRITYENLTTGQTFSPAVVLVHDAAADPLFKEGQAASFGIMRLAEEGNPAPAADMAVQKIGGDIGSVYISLPIGPGGTRAVNVTSDDAHTLLSIAWMLGRTNDGFTGANAIDLTKLTDKKSWDLMAYDAGTENNNEKKPYLIAMMGTDRDPENGTIGPHKGIRADVDAPAEWKFDPAQPVARLTIEPENPM
jgi:hypothetical protein